MKQVVEECVCTIVYTHRHALILSFLVLCGLAVTHPAYGQEQVPGVSADALVVDSLVAAAVEAEATVLNAEAEELLDRAHDNVEMANRIIDWSAMFFAAITLVFIIAGALGLREFSSIKSVREELRALNKEMEDEVESLQAFKLRFEEEMEELKKSIAKDSTNIIKIAYLSSEGTLYFQSGELGRAINAFREILRIKPHDYDSMCYLSRCYIGQGRYNRAIDTANKAIGLSERPDRGYRILGEAYRLMGRHDLSIEALLKSKELIRRRSTFNSLAYSYLKANSLEDSFQYFLESLEMRRGSTATCGLAKVYIKLGDMEKAQEYALETVKLADEEIQRGVLYLWPYYSITFAHLILGNEEECQAYMRMSVSKNKNPSLNNEMLSDLKLVLGEPGISQELVHECMKIIHESDGE